MKKISHPALELVNISKVYDNGTIANQDINLTLKYGEIHAIFGENGAGKSTLVKILSGAIKPTKGTIKFHGRPMLNYDLEVSKECDVAVVHQHFTLINNFSVFENIILGHELKSDEKLQKIHQEYRKKREELLALQAKTLPNSKEFHRIDRKLIRLMKWKISQENLFNCYRPEIKQRLKALIKKFNLNLTLEDIIHDISVSKKQKTEIMKVLFRKAKIIIFDEPTSVISDKEINVFLKSMEFYRKEGKAILFISHKINEICQVSDRISVIRKGKIVGHFKTKNASEQKLINLMIGDQKLISIANVTRKKNSQKVLLDVKNLSLTKEKQAFLRNISFQLYAGEIVGIAGIEDNGQKQLLEVLSGIERKYSGKIMYQSDYQLDKFSAMKLKAMGIAYIPQDRHSEGLLLDQPLTTNILFNYWKSPKFFNRFFQRKQAIIDQTTKVVENYQIHGIRSVNDLARNLSGGNQQKFIIGRELETKPNFLLIHEPTWGIDVGTINYLNHLFLKMRNNGKTILFTSSDLGQIVSLSDRIFVMNKGKIVGSLLPTDSNVFNRIGKLMA